MHIAVEKKLAEKGSLVPINKGIVCRVGKDCNVYLWSDQHFGSTECNYKLAEQVVDLIHKDKIGKVILGGDTLEAIPRNYKISERGQSTPPDFQVAETARRLRKIKDKILVLFKGNHNTQARGESMDSDYLLAELLDAPYKTVPTVVQLITPKGIVKLAGGHGHSGAKNGDNELNSLRKIFPDCQAYFLGHNHMLYAKQTGSLVHDIKGDEHWEEYWYIRTGNCLNYAEYARFAVYEPQRSGCIKVEIRDGKIQDCIEITSKAFK